MANSGVSLCVLLCMLAGYCHGDSVEIKDLTKRFLLSNVLETLGAAGSGSLAILIKSECAQCKCNNLCTGESISVQWLGLKQNETTICGKDLWNSINCADKHNFINTTSPTTNGQQGNVQSSCDKFCSLATIASARSVTHPNASMCLSGKQESNEALPMQCCHISSPNTWKKREAIMPLCLSIPHYTPVAAFINGNYIPGSAGIFSACLSGGDIGFQMIRQECGHAPELLHVSKNQTQNNNPDVYYVIQ